jgi:hypothetical protein
VIDFCVTPAVAANLKRCDPFTFDSNCGGLDIPFRLVGLRLGLRGFFLDVFLIISSKLTKLPFPSWRT